MTLAHQTRSRFGFGQRLGALLAEMAMALAILLVTPATLLGQDQARWDALERQDLRLLRVAERLQGSNLALCRSAMPLFGAILHSRDQYHEAAAQARFANGYVALAAVLPGSPADLAGLERDDGILAINGIATPGLATNTNRHLREAAFTLLASQPANRAIDLQVLRADGVHELSLRAPAGCRALVEVLVGDGPTARSDGKIIQVQLDFIARVDDEQLAVVVAHELAHVVLEHRRRKEEAGIDNGLLAEFGRNQQANRQAEVEADRLSVHLLANAGYDPAIAPAFWRSPVGRELGGLMPSFVYPSKEARAELLETEIALYLPLRRGASWPGHLLALRDTSFAGD